MNGTKLIYPNIDNGFRQGDRSIAEFFAYAQDVLAVLPGPDRNYFETFGRYGRDFSGIPILRPTKEILERDFSYLADGKYKQECHNTAEAHLKTYSDAKSECRLWWGIVDIKMNGKLMGMFCHSFLTLSMGDVVRVWDPMVMREDLLETGVEIYDHYGIHLPLRYLDRINAHAGMVGRNYTGYLNDKVFKSRKLTQRLWSELEKSKASL